MLYTMDGKKNGGVGTEDRLQYYLHMETFPHSSLHINSSIC